MAITKVCKGCQGDFAIEDMTCADSRCLVPDCKIHFAGAESVPGCDEIYCPPCWSKFGTEKKIG